MNKTSKFRAARNLPVGWVLHANHGRDKAERIFHWSVEIIVLLFLFICFYAVTDDDRLEIFVFVFLATHSIWWVVNGNFHVYLLDSFKAIRTRDRKTIGEFIEWMAGYLTKTDKVDAILLYGSACRGSFHRRSDLDIRVLRNERGIFNAIDLFSRAVVVRFVSLLKGIPTDLQVVDSMCFINQQMRIDEYPIVVFRSLNFSSPNEGMSLREFLSSSLAKNND